MAGKIQNSLAKQVEAAKPSVNQLMSNLLDGEKMRGRFEELLGKRAPQFVSSLVSLVNADPKMQKAFYESPMTVIQAGLKAATYDLPVDQNLGYAYIVPFENSKKQEDGTFIKRSEANFILGWKGMHQLAIRTGAYKTINVVDIREGELKKYNRLTEEIELEFIENEDERDVQPIIGYVGYYKLINGTEKTIYMTCKQIEKHEERHRKGKYMGKGWREDFDSMARKTVYRRLIGKWGVMSIEYQSMQDAEYTADYLSEKIAQPDQDLIPADFNVDITTGEVIENGES